MISRHNKFLTIVTFKNLLEKQINKNMTRPIKTAREVYLLLDAILENFDAFDCLGDNVSVYHIVDGENIRKDKIIRMKIGA